MGHQLPNDLMRARLTPDCVVLLGTWVAGVWLIGKAHQSLPWHATHAPKPAQSARSDADAPGLTRTLLLFGGAALATLAGGVVLEGSGDAMSRQLGMDGVLFGATVLAAATALPELSTGLASIKLNDYTLAISDIFGGNAFLPVLLALATILSGQPVLPTASRTDIYLTGLGMLVTVPYFFGTLFRSKRQIARMGLDSFAVLLIYLIGVAGLFLIA